MGKIDAIENRPPTDYVEQTHLYDGTAIDPQPMIKLEHDPNELTTRIIDILTPVGFGQRGLLVAPRARARRSFCKTSRAESTPIIPTCKSSCC